MDRPHAGTDLPVDVWPTRSGALLFPRLHALGAKERVGAVLAAVAPGSAVILDDPVVRDGLLARGGRQVRHLHTMRHDLHAVPTEPPVAGVSLRPWRTGDAALLAPALLTAYGPTHPDPREPDLAQALNALVETSEDPDNPLIVTATQVASVDGSAVGAALVLRSEHVRGWCGPWLMNMFRAPDRTHPRIGAVMLTAALEGLRSAAETRLGLAVTSTNPARHLYERLGFVYDYEGWVVVLPDAD